MRACKGLLLLLLLSPFLSSTPLYKRVVPLSPALTEMVAALGEGGRIVGVHTFTQFPEEVKRLPRIGVFQNVNTEVLLSLHPDLILAYREDVKARNICSRYKLECRFFAHKTLQDIQETIGGIGALLGRTKEAKGLNDRIRRGLGEVKKSVPRRLRVLVVVDREIGSFQNLYILGRGDFLSELLDLAGGENVYTGGLTYARVSQEIFYTSKPERIIELAPSLSERGLTPERLMQDWERFQGGVYRGRVSVVTDPLAVIPGPRVVETARLLRRLLRSLKP